MCARRALRFLNIAPHACTPPPASLPQLLYNLPPFAQLAGLSRLSALHYAVYAGGDAPGGLPAGDCQLSMRHLAVEERLLQESRLWIEDAPALERLLIKWWVCGCANIGALVEVMPGLEGSAALHAWDCRVIYGCTACRRRHLWVRRSGCSSVGLTTAPLPPFTRPLPPLRYVYPDCRAPGGRDFGDAKWDWLWRWAATHAPLRALCFDLGEGDEPTGLEAAAQRLRACRPTVRVEHCRFHAAWQELAAEWP